MVEDVSNKIEEKEEGQVALVHISPIIQDWKLDFYKELKAIVLIAYATGTTPQRINDKISELIKNGTEVFLLSSNYGDNFGIKNDRKYDTQALSKKAGARAIQTVNINNYDEVLSVIKYYLSIGYEKEDLGKLVEAHFAFEGQELPIGAIRKEVLDLIANSNLEEELKVGKLVFPSNIPTDSFSSRPSRP